MSPDTFNLGNRFASAAMSRSIEDANHSGMTLRHDERAANSRTPSEHDSLVRHVWTDYHVILVFWFNCQKLGQSLLSDNTREEMKRAESSGKKRVTSEKSLSSNSVLKEVRSLEILQSNWKS